MLVLPQSANIAQGQLLEAAARDFMTQEEKILKKKLINLLKDDGNGHHHARYAQCLSQFIIQIVPIGREPATAAISFDDGIIYINRGFLRDPKTFGQLNVIIRHELCHNLLMHQFRMIKYLKDAVPEAHLRTSMSINELLNILMDFEISNKKYTPEDKETVRNTWLNGRLISGLVTEDHVDTWKTLSLEDMYAAFERELKQAKAFGVSLLNSTPVIDNISQKLYSYVNDADSDFETLDDLKKHLKGMPEEWLKIFNDLQKNIVETEQVGYGLQDIEQLLKTIFTSKPIGKLDLISPVTGEVLTTVYTPEERQLAAEILKLMSNKSRYGSSYKAWYDEIMQKIGKSNFSNSEIQELLNSIK